MAKWSWQGMTQEQQEEITKLRGNMAYIGGLCRGTQDAITSQQIFKARWDERVGSRVMNSDA